MQIKFLFTAVFLFLFFNLNLRAQKQLEIRTQLRLDLSVNPTTASRNQQWIYYNVINDQQKGGPLHAAVWSLNGSIKLEATAFRTTIISLKSARPASLNPLLYRGMRVDDVVFPDILKGAFVLTNRAGGSWKKDFEFEISENPSQWEQISHVDLNASEQTLSEVSIYGFDFSREHKEIIEETIQTINRFYASLHLFQSLIQVPEPDHEIIPLFVVWDNSRKAIKSVSADLAAFQQGIDADSLSGWQQQYEAVKRRVIRYETLLNQVIGSDNHFDPGVFANVYTNALVQAYTASLSVDFRDQELFQELSLLQADKVFAAMLDKIAFSQETGDLTDRLFERLLEEAEKMYNRQDYANAHRLLNSMVESELVSHNKTLDDKLVALLIDARKGVLDAFFKINIKALETGNKDLAEQYYLKSMDFYARSFQKIPDDDIRVSAAQLIFAYQQQAKNKLQLDPLLALNDLRKAQQTAVVFDNRSLQQAVSEEITQLCQQYLDGLTTQIDYLLQNNYLQQAYVISEEAFGFVASQAAVNMDVQKLHEQQSIIETRLGSPAGRNSELSKLPQNSISLNTLNGQDSQQQMLAKKLIIEKIRSANQFVWANELDKAWEIYNEANDNATSLQLSNDPDIVDEFERLDAKIIERICLNEQNKFNRLMLEAERALRFSRVHDLKKLTAEARELVDKNRGCGINTSQLVQYEQSFEETFVYWEAYQDVLNTMYSAGFDAAIPKYIALDEAVKGMDLSALGNPHQDMFAFLAEQQNPLLTALAVEYFVDESDYSLAVKYFELFISQKPYSEQFEDIFIKAAKYFAAYDSVASETANPDELVFKYVPDDRAYRTFIKTYKKHFNS